MKTLIIEQQDIAQPKYLRLPKPGARDAITGLSRSTLAELTVSCPANDWKPPVKSLVLRKHGAQRGIRLISYESLLDYLRSLESQAQKATAPDP